MLIKLFIRMVDDFTEEEIAQYKEEMDTSKAIDADFDEIAFLNAKRRFVYMPLVVPIHDCLPFSKYDNKHTVISYGNQALIAKVNFERFEAIFTSITGETIRTEDEFKFEKPVKQPKS
jgi:hypothetical protein